MTTATALRRFIAPVALPIVRYATRSYVSGPELSDALRFANAAADRRLSATICYWNDGKENPETVADQYIAILDGIRANAIDAVLAVKIPALWDSEELTAKVVARARAQGTRVVFDSHAPDQADTTFRMIERLGPQGLGCVIPGRWRRSDGDARRAIELGVSVRIVKGEWVDPGDPKADLRAGFLRIVDVLSGSAVQVGVASHDAPLVRQSLARLIASGTRCEHEVLFPMPLEAAVEEARQAAVPVRLYIPFGEAWLPYSLSRAMANPSILLKFARDIAAGRKLKLPPRQRQAV